MSAMTDVLARTTSGSRTPPKAPVGDRRRPAALGAFLAAGWAALAGVLPAAAVAVVGWFATAGGTAAGALRVGLDAWLVMHGVPVALRDGHFGLTPLALSVLPVLLLCRAGAWVGRTCDVTRIRNVVAGVAALAVGYAGCAALVALVARTEGAVPDLVRAVAHAAVLAGVAGGLGVAAMSGHGSRLWQAVPEDCRAALYGGAAGFVALTTAGALMVAASLVVHWPRLTALADGLAPGPVGLVVLLVLNLAYAPNAAIYAGAFALGPGFAVGTGTVVAPTGVGLGALPAFPLLAALPVGEAPPAWVMSFLVLPIAAGMVAGVVALRRFPAYGIDGAALRGGLAGALGGLLFTACAAAAGGSAGPGRMADIGPDLLPTSVIAVSTLGIAGAVGVLGSYAWRWLRSRVVSRG
jgi:Family of unknown function (DUF6350)